MTGPGAESMGGPGAESMGGPGAESTRPMQTVDLKAYIEDNGYWYEEHGGRFIINCSEPYDAPSDGDRNPGSGVLGTLYVENGKLHFECQLYEEIDAGYNEHWTFSTLGEFADFYDRFLAEGIDGVV